MRFLFLLIACFSAPAADISFGIRVGGRATGAFDSSYGYREESKRYLAGPSLAVNLPRRFAFEANALYSRAGLGTSGCVFTYCSASSTRGNLWTIPLLLRFHLAAGPVRPYVTAGYSLRVAPDAGTEAESWRSGPIVSGEQVDYAIAHHRRIRWTSCGSELFSSLISACRRKQASRGIAH